MSQSLHTGQTPGVANASDGVPGITGAVTLQFAVNGTVSAIRLFTTTTVGGTYTANAWQVTAADPPGVPPSALATKVLVGAPAAGQWIDIVLDAPLAVTAGNYYRFGVHNSEGRYVATNNVFLSPVVNGDITAEASTANPFGNFSQGAFVINANAATFPAGEGVNADYFVDVLFDPAGGGTTPVSSAVDLRWRSFVGVTGSVSLRWAVISDAVFVPPVLAPATRLRTSELLAQRKVTTAFIRADLRTITLYRRDVVTGNAGQRVRGTAYPLPAQVFRLLPQEDGATERVTAEGQTATPEYVLLGAHDVDMKRFDTFEFDGRRYEVVFVSENRQYQVKGEVFYHGE